MSEWLAPCVKLVREFEGFERERADGLVASYPDPATGGKPWTIGAGSTGPDIGPKTVWTKAQCEARLLHDLNAKFGPAVDRMCEGIELTPNQKAALVSWVYNIGEANAKESTLIRKLRDGNIGGAGQEFLRWTYANHKQMRGLVRRREAERAAFLGIPRKP